MKNFVRKLTKGNRWLIGIILFFLVSSWSSVGTLLGTVASGIALIVLIVFLLLFRSVPSAPSAREKAEADAYAARQAEIEKHKAELEQAENERKDRIAEWNRTHGRIKTKIVGVTFSNEDGISRQSILKEYSASGDSSELSLEIYDYQCEKAIRAMYSGMCFGTIPKNSVPEILPIFDSITSLSLNVETFTPDDVDDDYDDDGKVKRSNKSKLYRADLTIVYAK